MADERCEDCAYYADLSHNFAVHKGFEQSHCCVAFVCTENTGYVVEVSPDDRCEMFARKRKDGDGNG
jgi:hypothetical protein